VVLQPLPGISTEAHFIEQFLRSLGNRIESGLPGGIRGIIFLPDHTLHFCDLGLNWLVPGEDLLDFVVAGLRNFGKGYAKLRYRGDNALIGLALSSTVRRDVQQLLLADCEARHHVLGGVTLI
jgi:hypothetical protein